MFESYFIKTKLSKLLCPEGTSFNQLTNGCTHSDFAICPSDELHGHLAQDLIFPDFKYHKSCALLHSNGTYEFRNQKPNNNALCGYKVIFFNTLSQI